MQPVEVVTRPQLPSETALPVSLLETLESHGLRPSWQKSTAEMLSTLHGQGLRPVTKAFLAELEIVDDGLFYTPEGYVQKYDCVLMVQPVELWEQKRERVDEIRRHREGRSAHVDALNNEIEDLMRRTGVNRQNFVGGGGLAANSIRVPDAREHVSVSRRPK